MSTDPVILAQASYDRSREAPEFFATLYAELFARVPAARAKFANTDFDRQYRLIDHGIGLLLNFSRQPQEGPNILSRLAGMHSRSELDVNPAMYQGFVIALLATVRQFDKEFNAEIEEAWRVATLDGVAYLASKY